MLNDIAMTTSDQGVRTTLVERGRRVVAGSTEKLAEPELEELKARLATLERSSVSGPQPEKVHDFQSANAAGV